MMDAVVQLEGTIYEEGYGLLARKVMRDPTLKHQSKSIYAYICSFASSKNSAERSAFPKVSLQVAELGMSEETYYKYRKPLVDKGYLKIEKFRTEDGKFERNLYKIVAVGDFEPYPKISGMDKKQPYPEIPSTAQPSTANPSTANSGTKSKSIKINNIKINKDKRFVNKEPINPFSREGLREIANGYYSKLAPGRWTKKQWNDLLDRMIEFMTDGEEFTTKAENPYGYVKVALENMANRHDWKHGKKEIEEVDGEGLVPFYNWIDQ
jgi:hypothetical protein